MTDEQVELVEVRGEVGAGRAEPEDERGERRGGGGVDRDAGAVDEGVAAGGGADRAGRYSAGDPLRPVG